MNSIFLCIFCFNLFEYSCHVGTVLLFHFVFILLLLERENIKNMQLGGRILKELKEGNKEKQNILYENFK